MIAMLRMLSRCCITPSYHAADDGPAPWGVSAARNAAGRSCPGSPCARGASVVEYNDRHVMSPEVRRMIRPALAFVLALGLAAGAPALAQTAPRPAAPAKPALKETQQAVVTLEQGGQVTLEFFPAEAPKHVEHFVTLARKGFYDGQRFHRVEPGFVVQIGDPQSKTLPMNHPAMGTGGPGYTIKAEFNKRPFDRGVLGMARTNDPDSAGSQFYIMLGPAHFLNGQYTAFGRVVSGMDVVDRIRVGDRVKSVRIVTK